MIPQWIKKKEKKFGKGKTIKIKFSFISKKHTYK
jgi:hypothetical protein